MSTAPTPAAPSLADLIPVHELAKAAKLAFDTLVSILSDAKATLNERRIAAMAVLRLTSAPKPPKRARSASEGQTPSAPAASPLSPPAGAPERPPATQALHVHRLPAHRLMVTAGAPPIDRTPSFTARQPPVRELRPTPPPRLNG